MCPGQRCAALIHMMVVDQFDFGEEFAEDLFPDDKDNEMDGSFLHSPRMALADLFDELVNQTTTPKPTARCWMVVC